MLRLALKVSAIALAAVIVIGVAIIATTWWIDLRPSFAFDNGQWNGVDAKTRQWFKSVKSPHGIPCCDLSDGHHTKWRPSSTGGYEVPIEGEWVAVPDEAIVREYGNPTGEAIIWWVRYPDGELRIRCFVPEAQG